MIAFIDDHRDAHGVEPICRVLPIAPSTYHDHVASRADPSRLSARAKRDAALRPEIALPASPSVSQQHGFIHAGALAAIADTAAGYAALSLMPAGVGVLTTEFKINLVAPAKGDRVIARGRVVKAGRTLTLGQTEVFAESATGEKLVALLTATLMVIEGREGIAD